MRTRRVHRSLIDSEKRSRDRPPESSSDVRFDLTHARRLQQDLLPEKKPRFHRLTYTKCKINSSLGELLLDIISSK